MAYIKVKRGYFSFNTILRKARDSRNRSVKQMSVVASQLLYHSELVHILFHLRDRFENNNLKNVSFYRKYLFCTPVFVSQMWGKQLK
jgi:hypothetical protein